MQVKISKKKMLAQIANSTAAAPRRRFLAERPAGRRLRWFVVEFMGIDVCVFTGRAGVLLTAFASIS